MFPKTRGAFIRTTVITCTSAHIAFHGHGSFPLQSQCDQSLSCRAIEIYNRCSVIYWIALATYRPNTVKFLKIMACGADVMYSLALAAVVIVIPIMGFPLPPADETTVFHLSAPASLRPINHSFGGHRPRRWTSTLISRKVVSRSLLQGVHKQWLCLDSEQPHRIYPSCLILTLHPSHRVGTTSLSAGKR